MTTTAHETLPGRPPIVDAATWQQARDELLVREKAHTREGDAIAAARRRLPMVEFDGHVEIVGPDGSVPFLDLFEGRDELVVYKHMWWDGSPHQGQCEGCSLWAWHLKDAVYLNARGVSFAILTTGRWEEVSPFVEFMGYTQPWYSVRDVPEPIGGDMGVIASFLRDGDRTFLTYSTTGRGNEAAVGTFGLLDMTPYGRGEHGRTSPRAGRMAIRPAGTGARTPTVIRLGARRAARHHSGPGRVRVPSTPSAVPDITTDSDIARSAEGERSSQQRADVAVSMENAPHVDVIVAFDVEDHVRESLQCARAKIRNG